jgi:hypothetical protein
MHKPTCFPREIDQLMAQVDAREAPFSRFAYRRVHRRIRNFVPDDERRNDFHFESMLSERCDAERAVMLPKVCQWFLHVTKAALDGEPCAQFPIIMRDKVGIRSTEMLERFSPDHQRIGTADAIKRGVFRHKPCECWSGDVTLT